MEKRDAHEASIAESVATFHTASTGSLPASLPGLEQVEPTVLVDRSLKSFDTGKAVKVVDAAHPVGDLKKVTFEDKETGEVLPPRMGSDDGVPFNNPKKKETVFDKIFRVLGINRHR